MLNITCSSSAIALSDPIFVSTSPDNRSTNLVHDLTVISDAYTAYTIASLQDKPERFYRQELAIVPATTEKHRSCAGFQVRFHVNADPVTGFFFSIRWCLWLFISWRGIFSRQSCPGKSPISASAHHRMSSDECHRNILTAERPVRWQADGTPVRQPRTFLGTCPHQSFSHLLFILLLHWFYNFN